MMLLTNNVSFNGSQVCLFADHQNRDIRAYDLSKISVVNVNGQNVKVPQMTVISRPASVTNMRMGYLWTDPTERYIYRYGGNWIDPPDVRARINDDSSKSALVGLDTKASNLSNADAWYLPPKASPPNINRLAMGAGARSVSDYKGFYLGGFDDGLGNDHRSKDSELASLRNSLVTWDGKSNVWTNQTVTKTASTAESYNPGAAGVLLHVPVGQKGMLVSIGGHLFEGDSPRLPMDNIRVFNMNDDKWYEQTAVGDIPQPRMYFCGVMSAAADKSSYNIYISGGSTSDAQGVDDVYILSIPSFRWFKAYSGSGFPRHGHTCEIVQGTQMAVIGGFNTTSLPSGACALDMGGDLRFFDMTNLTYTGYASKRDDYRVPQAVYQTIGGDASGGAMIKEPVGGWTDPLFKASFTGAVAGAAAPVNGPLTPPGSGQLGANPVSTAPTGSKTAVIAGGIVGGAVFFSLLIALLWLLVRRRRGARHQIHDIKLVLEKDAIKPLPQSPSTFAGSKGPLSPEESPYGFATAQKPSPTAQYDPYSNSRSPTSPADSFNQYYYKQPTSPTELPAYGQKMVYGDVPAPLRPLRRSNTADSAPNPPAYPSELSVSPPLRSNTADSPFGYGADYSRTRIQPTRPPRAMIGGADQGRRPPQVRQIHELPSRTSKGDKNGLRVVPEAVSLRRSGLEPPLEGRIEGEKF